MPTLYTVIRRPLITEKGMTVKETQNTLVFEVALKATKTEVKQAVESLFKLKVEGVRTATVEGKERRRGKFSGLPSRLEEGLCPSERGREDAGLPQQHLVDGSSFLAVSMSYLTGALRLQLNRARPRRMDLHDAD